MFDTLQTGLSKLGDTSSSRTKAISDLLQLIKDIPMDEKQGYDVLGFIYEYLISNFAANAGKKAGEFYTPHEVSLLMSEIVANHLKNKNEIKIYDPTSGSGSLLINIGHSAAKFMDSERIQYYAQELKENTYNLTRMNLVMRGIKPANIITRNADTLEDDWPVDLDQYPPVLRVDAVVSNPPYSQQWNPEGKESDPRYNDYGLAPKGKADYAFLLHDLYHIKPDGIMTIVLPHGVLFRGGEEEKIRKNLIEKNNIDAIIGLPANIFFGTGIPTIIMVLKQNRTNNDVLIIDASKGFVKVGKNNKLQASDIKKIVDVISERKSVPKFSKVVSRDDIRVNDYNLNIPRYVDSSEEAESYDIYASMNGGIPNSEIDKISEYWAAFPKLRESLFTNNGTPYSSLAVSDIKKAITENQDVVSFIAKYKSAFSDFDSQLADELISNMENVVPAKEEALIGENIFTRLTNIPLVNPYSAYQILDDIWTEIAVDFDIMQSEGYDSITVVEPNMIIKKKDNKDTEVQDGWKGKILPFELVQQTLLSDNLKAIQAKESRVSEISGEIEELIGILSAEEQETYLNDDNNAFVPAKAKDLLKTAVDDISTPEIDGLRGYIELIDKKASKKEKADYVEKVDAVCWTAIEANKGGDYGKNKINNRIKELIAGYEFKKGSLEYVLSSALNLLEEEKEIKKSIKEMSAELHLKTKKEIETLSEQDKTMLVHAKWIAPLVSSIMELPEMVISELVKKIQALADKYKDTLIELENDIDLAENALSVMINDLCGSEFDMKGLADLKKLLGGE